MSGLIDPGDIQRVLQAVNIVDVVNRYVSLSPRGKEWVGLCPFHEDHKPSMYVNPQKQIFKCFACGAGGTTASFLMRREKWSFAETIQFLAEQTGITLRRSRRTEQETGRRNLAQVNQQAARYFREQLTNERQGLRARNYLEKRGVSGEMVDRFGLGWAAPEWDGLTRWAGREGISPTVLEQAGLAKARESGGHYDRFRERVMFPVIDTFGKVIAFGGRTLGDDDAKYLNSPETELFSKRQSLYGLHQARDAISKNRSAIVVEGYMDCLMAHQFGLEHTVATLGTALTSEHARLLGRFADRLILVFDADQAGQKATERAIDVLLGQRLTIGLVTLPAGMDPCDYLLEHGTEAFEQLIEQAESILEYKWRSMVSGLEQADSLAQRSDAVDRYLETVVASLAQGRLDSVEQGLVINTVAKVLELPVEQVHEKVRQLRRRDGRETEPGEYAVGNTARVGVGLERALQEILELILVQPGLFEQVRGEVGSADYADTWMAGLAGRVWRAYDRGDTSIAAAMADCDDLEVCEQAADLTLRGETIADPVQTMSGALDYVRGQRRFESANRIEQGLAEAQRMNYGADAERAYLQELMAEYRPDPIRPGRGSER